MEIRKGTGPISLGEVARQTLAPRVTPEVAPVETPTAKPVEGDADRTNRKTGPLSGSQIELGGFAAKVAKDLIIAAQEAGEEFDGVGQKIQGIARTRQSGGGGIGEFQL